MLFRFNPVKVQTQPDVFSSHAVCFRDTRVSYTAERISSDSCSICRVEKANIKF